MKSALQRALPLLGLLASACGGGTPSETQPSTGAASAAWFRDVAQERGLDFVHRTGADGRFLMPEIMSTAAALVDLDGDGTPEYLQPWVPASGTTDVAGCATAPGPERRAPPWGFVLWVLAAIGGRRWRVRG